MEEFKEEVKRQAEKLICETHPKVCEMRDSNYTKLERMIITQVTAGNEGVSIQTAIAEVETALSE